MTLGDLKKKTLSLIEEINTEEESLTDDPDIEAKLPYVISQILNELCRFKKIPAYEVVTVSKDQVYELNDLDNFYQLNIIRGVDYDFLNETTVVFNEDGEAKIAYYVYPDTINEKTLDTKTLNLSNDVLEIAPYGIAADLLKSDVSTNYGQIYAQRYNQMLQMLDSRYSTTSVEFSGGIEI